MAKWYVTFVLAVVLVHATARNVPSTKAPSPSEAGVNHEQTDAVNVANATAPNGKGVKDKKCGFVFAGIGGAAGVGGVIPLIPLGGIGGLGGVGGVGGAGGLGGLGGVGGLGGAGGVGGGAGGVGGGGGILP